MHPILGRMNRLAPYLAAWTMAGVLASGVLTRLGLGWVDALALLVPLFLVYAFACLSAWYICRAFPLATTGLVRVLASSGVAAILASAIWMAIARAWIAALGWTPAFAASPARYEQQLPLLFAIGVLLYLLASAVHYVLLALEAVRVAERQRFELEVLTREAELRALRAQLDPHFLYNSLNSISALTGVDPAGARRMCLLLGDFLRNTLSVGGQNQIRLADELALADRFLDIEQIRFGSRLQVQRAIDPIASECLVPPLILQPLFENAVVHGIAGLLDGGVIRVAVARRNGALCIAIENPRDADAPAAAVRGVGLDNVRRRLAMTFGPAAKLDTQAGPGSFRAELDLPWALDHR
jgi:two-component system, LytTR family, sensor histidine kinase AlgZ